MPYYADSGARFGGLFDSLTGALQAVVPPNTIVGKLLGGNVAGAATATVKLATGGSSAPAPVKPTAAPGLFAPGGFVQRNQTVLLLVAAGLVVLLVTRKKGRK